MQKTLLLTILLLAFGISSANSLTGKILDSKTNQPLAFASIGVKNSSVGTISNGDGIYVININGLEESDTVLVSYIGYETFKTTIGQLIKSSDIFLKPAAINLTEFQVNSEPLTVDQILEKVKEKYELNYPKASIKQKLFYHRYENSPFPTRDQIKFKQSDFVGLDEKTFDEFFELMPDEMTEYQDAIVEVYQMGEKQRMLPIQGISLQESSMEDVTEELEEKLKVFFDDIEATNKTTDIYYKFRTGIFSTKVGHKDSPDSTWQEEREDSLNYHLTTDHLKGSINWLVNNFASLDSDNWEFINKTGKYQYQLHELNVLNDELVYDISFKPKKGGLYQGRVYISTQSFAVVQLDYEFAPGKDSENFNLLGFSHSMKYKKCRVIYQKDGIGYYPKYVYAEQNEEAAVNRSFTIKKKKKRFLVDKELNEMKFETDIYFDVNIYWELLVMNREEITSKEFTSVVEPRTMKFKKEYAYSPEMWNSTVIAPTAELGKYKRSIDD